uniref:Uncharacterized protein n=1 Tax=Pseudictyota dubia TaxID=2749911 RepID=A0A7R9WLZ0_9STRA|mmetsp:Transcript_8898/g.16439  ORF Transcript_8898/g.16439 Transcript_8898/m.16439 type:complete len:236 (+) Transcript_8898:1546-2253(+)
MKLYCKVRPPPSHFPRFDATEAIALRLRTFEICDPRRDFTASTMRDGPVRLAPPSIIVGVGVDRERTLLLGRWMLRTAARGRIFDLFLRQRRIHLHIRLCMLLLLLLLLYGRCSAAESLLLPDGCARRSRVCPSSIVSDEERRAQELQEYGVEERRAQEFQQGAQKVQDWYPRRLDRVVVPSSTGSVASSALPSDLPLLGLCPKGNYRRPIFYLLYAPEALGRASMVGGMMSCRS